MSRNNVTGLVFAPSGAGKTFYASRGLWVDGDRVVGAANFWPVYDKAKPPWWRTWPQLDLWRLYATHLMMLAAAAFHGRQVVAYHAPASPVTLAFLRLFRPRIVVWLPSEDQMHRNVAAGGRPNQPGGQDLLNSWTRYRDFWAAGEATHTEGVMIVDRAEAAVDFLRGQGLVTAETKLWENRFSDDQIREFLAGPFQTEGADGMPPPPPQTSVQGVRANGPVQTYPIQAPEPARPDDAPDAGGADAHRDRPESAGARLQPAD